MPVHRKRRRYIKFWIRGDDGFSVKEVADAIQRSVLALYGVQGLSTIEPNLIDFDEDSQSGILRCSHSHLRETRASLAFITSIGEGAAAIHVDKVSGTIRSLKKGGEKA
jgi:ribonuclease P/MRP protein subunit POP5